MNKLSGATCAFFLAAICINDVYSLDAPDFLPCPLGLVSFVVRDSATASDLARAASCSGGTFDVQWFGDIEFPETIYVADGTVMNITAASASSIADGAGDKQFLAVFDAEVHVEGLHVTNCATSTSGGAIYAERSKMSFDGTTWSNNVAGVDGGAVYLEDCSGVSWSGDTTWSDNTAGDDGGAVYMLSSTGVSWSGESMWSGNSAGDNGGATCVYSSSSVSWSGVHTWSHNTAGNDGGAVFVDGSMGVLWSGANAWYGSVATGSFGGAVLIQLCSDVSWSGETLWSNNTAGRYGGAVNVWTSSDVSWSGNTTWSYNTVGGGADIGGGAISVSHVERASWSGETTWSHNTAIDGSGGAVYVDDSSNLVWDGVNTWSHNTALGGSGGAVFLRPFQDVILGVFWSGENTFSHNIATDDGGAVCVLDSAGVEWSGIATWYNNTATSGGAIYLLRSTVVMTDTAYFQSNAANGAGGALMLSGVDDTLFLRTSFTSNYSPRGGAVYSVSSGIKTENTGAEPIFFPIVYQDCLFKGNWATASGGAMESLAGYDVVLHTVFERNTAGVGGALRLGGTASLTNCTFVDNISDEDEGSAISNLGVLETEESRFSGNTFSCERGTYLDSADGDGYAKACNGCDECGSCEVENEDQVPICFDQIDNTRSEGGNTTLETLQVNPGYWRAVDTSPHALACYNEKACRGGLTSSSEFCKQGYEGPYCSVCSEDYSMALAFTCTKCMDSGGSAAIISIVIVLGIGAIIVLYMHLVSGEMDGAREGIIQRVTKRLPVQSIKIVVVVWQILTQFSSVANVTYPNVYQRFLDGVNILNFDVLWIPSAGCIMDVDFHDRLLAATIGPLLAVAFLAGTYAVAKRRNRGSETALQKVGQKHTSMLLLLSFLIYSSVSAKVFQTFACENLDDGREYLRVDYRIECDSTKHQFFQVYAGIMILVYPVGVPLFYAFLLYKNRHVLKNKVERQTSPQVQPISDLWVPYKPERWYYDVIECLRRTSLTGVVVFIYPNTAAQVAVTLVIAFAFAILSESLAPYVSKWDARVSLTGHIIIFVSMYVGLLGKVDVSSERTTSQEVFGGILVASHAFLIAVVVVETVILTLSMRRKEGGLFPAKLPRPSIKLRRLFSSSKEAAAFSS